MLSALQIGVKCVEGTVNDARVHRQEVFFPFSPRAFPRFYYDVALRQIESIAVDIVARCQKDTSPFDLDEASESLIQSLCLFFAGFRTVLLVAPPDLVPGIEALLRIIQSPWPRHDTHVPYVVCLHQLDADYFWEVLSVFESKSMGALVLSPAGDEISVVAQFSRLIDHLGSPEKSEKWRQKIAVVAPAQACPVRALAEAFSCTICDLSEPDEGPLSALSWMHMLPAAIAGVNAKRVCTGASYFFYRFAQNKDRAPLEGAALSVALWQNQWSGGHIWIPTQHRVEPIARWLAAVFNLVQNKTSRAQMWNVAMESKTQLAGLRTLLVNTRFVSERLSPKLIDPLVDDVSRHSCFDLATQQREHHVHNMMRDHIYPFRVIRMEAYDEIGVGALMAHGLVESLLWRAWAETGDH